jgi:hypothetical protein
MVPKMMTPYDDLPERWKERLHRYIKDVLKSRYDRLGAGDFPYTVSISLEDGSSYALFRYAFYLADEDLGEIVVFTEHCRYHLFPLHGTRVELLEPKYEQTYED